MFGLLYGECFGPTGLVPTLWLSPLDHPLTLLAGGGRHRGGHARGRLRARHGQPVAGRRLDLCVVRAVGRRRNRRVPRRGHLAGGWYFQHGLLLAAGGSVALAGLALAAVGFLAEAGGGGAGGIQASVELFDLVVRLGSNVVSFTRLAAFGLTHAALGLLVWEGTRALWRHGGLFTVPAVVVFAAGTALAFSLEALVAAIQALRLEYYELFSRVFVTQGRPFRPGTCRRCRAPGLVPSAGSPGLSMKEGAHECRMDSRIAADRRGRRAGAGGDPARAVRDLHPGRDRRPS